MTCPPALLERLRQEGLRLTPQREMVLSVICENGGHITADGILQQARERYPYLNKSAVYRTLDLLMRLRVVNSIDFGEGCIEYEIHQHPHHHHLLCRHCGERTEVDEHILVSLGKTLRAEYGFTAELGHLAILGTCKRCSAPPRKPQARRKSAPAHAG